MRLRSMTGVLATLLTCAAAHAQATTMPTDVAALQERVRALEAQVAELQAKLAAATGGPAASGQASPKQVDAATLATIRNQARARMRADSQTYTREQLAEIEQLYQPSNDRAQRGTPAVKAALEKLIAQFPKSNRAACAMLYLAQWAQGEERERLLKDAAEKYGDAFYGDGCQVGPYALFQLAEYYARSGAPDKAKATYDTLRAKYATAIDHGGQTLVSQIPERSVVMARAARRVASLTRLADERSGVDGASSDTARCQILRSLRLPQDDAA